jgi:hypothetical protein
MQSTHLRAAALVAFLPAMTAVSQAPTVAGTYDTKVSIVSASSGCTLPVQDNPTVVQLTRGDSVVLLTHAGTTYGGALKKDSSFTTQEKKIDVNGVSYAMTVSGRFTGAKLVANATLDYGTAPKCHVVVRWVGTKRS